MSGSITYCNLLLILTQVQPYHKEICSNLGSVCGAWLVEEDGQGVGRGVARRQGVGQHVAAQVQPGSRRGY